MVRALLGLVTFAASGCTAPAAILYSGAREESLRVFEMELRETQPYVPYDAAAGCVLNAMTYREVIGFGTQDLRRVTTAQKARMTELAARPDAVDCIAQLENAA